MWWERRPVSVQALETTIRQNSAIVAASAVIERDSPKPAPGIGPVRGWNTLALVRPTVASTAAEVHGPCFLIIAEGAWVSGDVNVAIQTKIDFMKRFKIASGPGAILPSKVIVYKVDDHDMAKRIDSHEINYLRIDDPVQEYQGK